MQVRADREGWRSLNPGVTGWAAIVGSAAFSLLLLYVYFFVGSARADAEAQMAYCLALAIAFAIASLSLGLMILSQRVSWRAAELRVRPLLGAPTVMHLADLTAIRVRASSTMIYLHFSDGRIVKVSPQMGGARELLDHVYEAWPPDHPRDPSVRL